MCVIACYMPPLAEWGLTAGLLPFLRATLQDLTGSQMDQNETHPSKGLSTQLSIESRWAYTNEYSICQICPSGKTICPHASFVYLHARFEAKPQLCCVIYKIRALHERVHTFSLFDCQKVNASDFFYHHFT